MPSESSTIKEIESKVRETKKERKWSQNLEQEDTYIQTDRNKILRIREGERNIDRRDKIDMKDWKETTREQISSSLKLTFAFTKGSTDIREVMIWYPFSDKVRKKYKIYIWSTIVF